eukprot:Seg9047.2 transcript_id=Seg9047.2/GoldUCD/mRNA.D3Y31 product="hypothetical protein" protein_id=Seg9047.2/GoldUCD/D3Y31
MKTATGIKRLQDEKGYGPWFDQLFALVKIRDSCQPEQAIEPSIVDSEKDMTSSSSASTSTISDDFFVSSKKASRKRKTQDTLSESVEIFKTVIQNDPMKDFIAFAHEEAEKARQHELRMMELLLGGMGNAPPGGVKISRTDTKKVHTVACYIRTNCSTMSPHRKYGALLLPEGELMDSIDNKKTMKQAVITNCSTAFIC